MEGECLYIANSQEDPPQLVGDTRHNSGLPHAEAMRLPASTTDSIPHDGVTEVLCPQA